MTPQAYRVACSQLDPSVSRSPIWSYATAGPRPLASSGSSSPELHLSYRVLTVPDLLVAEAKSASLGVPLFPIATSTDRVHLRASFPSSPYGPPSAFLTPSTVYSSSSLAGLFHPAATSGIHLSGVCSRCQAASPRRRPVPSCRSANLACRRVASAAPAPSASPPGSCSGQRSEIIVRVIGPSDASIPS